MKDLFVFLSGIALSATTAHASLAITNGDFQTSAPAATQADVVGWFDDSPSPTNWWEGAWYGPTVSPFTTNRSCLGLSWQGGTPHWAYQGIGTNSAGAQNLKLQFDAGSFTDAGEARNLGIKVDLYQSNGSFVGGDNVDIATAGGVTLISTFSVATGNLTAGQTVTALNGTLSLATANTTGQLFLRISNYAAGAGQPWAAVDNLVIVADVPAFTTQPANYAGLIGDTVTLTAAATSDPAPTYQWQYSPNGSAPWSPVGGATDSSLVLTTTTAANTGYYRVIATNGANSATSNSAHVELQALAITNGDFETGAPAAGANQPDVARWFDDGPNPGNWWEGNWQGSLVSPFFANKSCLGLSYLNATGHWAYQHIGTNSAGFQNLKIQFDAGSLTDATGVRNIGVTVSLYQSDGSFTGADNVDIATAGGVTLVSTFSVATGDLSAGQVLLGLNGTLSLATANTTGPLFLRVSNYAAGTGEPWGAVDNLVIVANVPTFTSHPASYNGFVGDLLTLTAAATADPAPTYQWEYSPTGSAPWTPVDGATEPSLALTPVAYSNKGYYRVIATNTNSSTASNVAHVNLAYPNPTIFGQPVPSVVETGSSASFTVLASGLGTLTYQWYKNGGVIDGAVANILTFDSAQQSDAGQYSVTITDDAAVADGQPATSVMSVSATLAVYAPWSGLVSHEPLSISAGYAVGDLPLQNPAIPGYSAAWTDIDFGDAEPAVSAGSLAYGDSLYLGSSGDKVAVPTEITGGEITLANSGRVYRLLDPALVATDSTAGVRYLSFLFQSGQETGATIYQALSLNSANGDANRNFDIGLTNNGGQPGTAYNFGVDNAYSSTGATANTSVHLMVVKFNLSATGFGDSVTVWVDPALGSGDPAGGVTVADVNLTWDRLVLSDYDGNSAAWDEIRWGSSFNSVTWNLNPPVNFAAWIAGYPAVGSQSGFNDDPDGDGTGNGLENLLGTNPGVSSKGIDQVAGSGNTVTFQHSQNASPASDVSAAYVWSTDLATFHANGESSGGATVSFAAAPNTPATGTTSVTATITGTVPSKLFVSLKATRGAP
ncbi:MAG: immunoglobulin domain-containing protein [Verrucomicrobiota bacterium]